MGLKDVNGLSIKELAKAEVRDEIKAEAVSELKSKYRLLKDAKVIVRNIERDIADYEEVIAEELTNA